jgi:hypothetical protein
MAKRTPKTRKKKHQEFVVVAYAEDLEQARNYEALLKNNDIETIVKERHDKSTGAETIAVMVPEDSLDEAHVVIESQDAYDDFYDYALEDDEEDDFDTDFYDEDF